jgi:hypothetical protein
VAIVEKMMKKVELTGVNVEHHLRFGRVRQRNEWLGKVRFSEFFIVLL